MYFNEASLIVQQDAEVWGGWRPGPESCVHACLRICWCRLRVEEGDGGTITIRRGVEIGMSVTAAAIAIAIAILSSPESR